MIFLFIIQAVDTKRTGDNAQTDLMIAAKSNNLDEVKKLLYDGANPNLKDNVGRTALHHSADFATNVEISKLLISYGADCNALTFTQWTPLHFAAQNGHEKTCQLLLQHEADCNALNVDQWTPLHIAARYGHEKTCQLLLQHGADCNALNVNQWTPLHFAAANGREKICQLLLQHGADPKMKTNSGSTALAFAKTSEYIKDENVRRNIIALLTPITPKTYRKFPFFT